MKKEKRKKILQLSQEIHPEASLDTMSREETSFSTPSTLLRMRTLPSLNTREGNSKPLFITGQIHSEGQNGQTSVLARMAKSSE